jgi:hypothetical protein
MFFRQNYSQRLLVYSLVFQQVELQQQF